MISSFLNTYGIDDLPFSLRQALMDRGKLKVLVLASAVT